MTIEALVEDALDLLRRGRFDSAMSLACACLDAAAAAEIGGSVGNRWKGFINSRLDIITAVGFRGALLVVPGSKLNVKNPANPAETIPIEDVIYKAIRCYLLHEASLPAGVSFVSEAFYGERGGAFHLPSTLILSVLLAVVAAPSNASRFLVNDITIALESSALSVNATWGKTPELRRFLGLAP